MRFEDALTLRDGSRVLIRQIVPSDRRALKASFQRLSRHSRRMRFLAYKSALSNSELDYFTNVDHVDHEALIATDADDAEILAVARYVRLRSDRQCAEAAVVVTDRWQRRGLGTALLKRLAERAREHGIRRFEGQALYENRPVIGLFKKLGALDLSSGRGVAEFVVELPS